MWCIAALLNGVSLAFRGGLLPVVRKIFLWSKAHIDVANGLHKCRYTDPIISPVMGQEKRLVGHFNDVGQDILCLWISGRGRGRLLIAPLLVCTISVTAAEKK